MSEIISVEHLAYTYPGVEDTPGIPVFEDMNLKIQEGSFVAVLGTNGCGKSTLAKHFNSILLPSGGKVYVSGIDTSDQERIMTVRRIVGMVFQNPDNQIVATIVEDDVAFGPENIGVPREEIIERVNEALEAVGMSEYRKRSASKLSGGQKQRIAIAGVLAMRPQILILDESTSMLDPNGRKEIMAIAKKLNEQGITVINITHNMDEAVLADRIIVLRKGRVAIDGTPKEVFASGLLEACGLTLPPVYALCKSLERKGFVFDSAALTEEELAEGVCRQLK